MQIKILHFFLHRNINIINRSSILSVTVIIIKNGIGDQSSNPGQGCLHFT